MKNNTAINEFKQPNEQQQLFTYLKHSQQEKVRPVLRLLKPAYQGKLCAQLLDYMETGVLPLAEDVMLDTFAFYLVGRTNGQNRAIIEPLCAEPKGPFAEALGVKIQISNIQE